MNRPGMEAAGAVLSCLLLGLAGCMELATPGSQPRQDKAPVAEAKQPPDAPANADGADEAQRMENLAAVREFLERTQDLPAPTRRTARAEEPADGRTGPIDGGAAPKLDPRAAAATPRAAANTQVELTPEPARRVQALPVIQSVSIRTSEPGPAAAGATPEKVTNAPLDLARSSQVHAIDTLYASWQTGAEGTADVEAQWRLMLLQLALGRDVEAGTLSPNLSPGAREVLKAFVPAALAARAAARNPLLVDDNQLTPADGLRRALSDLADPVVSRIALCKRVVTFGVYEDMPPTEFVAGRPIPAILYCEIRNFASERTEDERFRSRLGTRLEILSADGRSVWEQTEPEIEDLSRTRRTDFFLAQRITLPATLPAGEYTVKVFVEDKLSAKANESTLALTIMEQASVANARP